MAEMLFQFAGNEVTGDDAAGFTVDHHHIQHFMTGEHGHRSEGNLPFECAVSTKSNCCPVCPAA